MMDPIRDRRRGQTLAYSELLYILMYIVLQRRLSCIYFYILINCVSRFDLIFVFVTNLLLL